MFSKYRQVYVRVSRSRVTHCEIAHYSEVALIIDSEAITITFAIGLLARAMSPAREKTSRAHNGKEVQGSAQQVHSGSPEMLKMHSIPACI